MCKIIDLGTKEFPEGWTFGDILGDSKLPVVLLVSNDIREVIEEAQLSILSTGGARELYLGPGSEIPGEVHHLREVGNLFAPQPCLPTGAPATAAAQMACDIGTVCHSPQGRVIAFCMNDTND